MINLDEAMAVLQALSDEQVNNLIEQCLIESNIPYAKSKQINLSERKWTLEDLFKAEE